MKQTTLLSSWCGSSRQAATSSSTTADALLTDDDDVLLLDAMDDLPKSSEKNDEGNSYKSRLKPMRYSYKPTKNDSPLLDGFDIESGVNWTYPTNFPVREYQLNIVQECLFKNTLVCLPTGLGKTFVAAVVMYNIYQWYPHGKVIFTAPTRPLVAQQMDACYRIMGIPSDLTTEMTGSMPSSVRKHEWQIRRLIFLTPQVMVNDIKSGACPVEKVKCLVVDEAHKATGNHAYCQLVRAMFEKTQLFRILSLTATPGSDIQTVQEVMQNLLISHIELRTEECRDIKAYSFERNVEKVIVPLGKEIDDFKGRLYRILDVLIKRLHQQGALGGRCTVASLSKFALIKQRQFLMQQNFMNIDRAAIPFIYRDFTVAVSLYHGYELLQQHGLRPVFTYLDGILKGEKSAPVVRQELRKMPEFQEIWDLLERRYRMDPNASLREVLSSQKDFVSGHPKLDKLLEIVLTHFTRYKVDQNSRVIVFSQFRDSVSEILHMLKKHQPIIKPVSFIGQSTGGRSKGYTQKDQLRVMREFRDGIYNVLVSTCIGEEGLDIGEVDLIICFDSAKSPVRLIQRMGRTGRKRVGRIIMLLSEGKEVSNYNTSLAKKKSIHKAIFDGVKRLQFYPDNPRMVPLGLNPEVIFKEMEVAKTDITSLKRKVIDKSNKNQTTISSILKKKKQATHFLSTQVKTSFHQSRGIMKESVGNVRFEHTPLISLMTKQEKDDYFAKEEVVKNYQRFNRKIHDTWSVDHSSITRDSVAVLRLMNENRKGRTSLMYHALGLREVNIDNPATQSDPFSRPQHDFSSDDDFDVKSVSIRKSIAGVSGKSEVEDDDVGHIEDVPDSPVFGSCTQASKVITGECVKRYEYLTKPMRRIPMPPSLELIDILINDLGDVDLNSCSPVRIRKLNNLKFPPSQVWDLDDENDDLIAGCLNGDDKMDFDDLGIHEDGNESADSGSKILYVQAEQSLGNPTERNSHEKSEIVEEDCRLVKTAQSHLSKIHSNASKRTSSFGNHFQFDCNLMFSDVQDLSAWDSPLDQGRDDGRGINSSMKYENNENNQNVEVNQRMSMHSENDKREEFTTPMSFSKRALLACFHTPNNSVVRSAKIGSAKVTITQALNLLNASFSFDIGEPLLNEEQSLISTNTGKAFINDCHHHRTSSPKFSNATNSKKSSFLSNFNAPEIEGQTLFKDEFDYNLLIDNSWDYSHKSTMKTSSRMELNEDRENSIIFNKVNCESPTPTNKSLSISTKSDNADETSILIGGKRNRLQVIESEESGNEEFESPPWLTKKPNEIVYFKKTKGRDKENVSSDDFQHSVTMNQKAKKRITKSSKPGHQFILSQASDDENDDSIGHDHSGDNDSYDSSFVNDDFSPDVKQKKKMYAVYAQSLRNARNTNARFKLQFLPVVEEHKMIFSQKPEQDDDYERDSFCVSESETPEKEVKTSRKRQGDTRLNVKSKRRRLLEESSELSDSSDFR